jgi:hypothetical protein
MKITDEVIEAVQKANNYALDDALIRRVLEPAFEFVSQQNIARGAEAGRKR